MAQQEEDCIIIGDFNFPQVDWDTLTSSSEHGNLFISATQDSFLVQKVHSPTHNAGNILDLVFSNNGSAITEDILVIEEEKVSDHFPLLVQINQSFKLKESSEMIPDYRKADFGLFREILCVNWTHVLANKNTEEMWTEIKERIQFAAQQSIPFVGRRNNKPRWLTPRVKNHNNKKRRAWKTYKVHRTEENKKKFREIKEQTKQILMQEIIAYEKTIADKLGSDPKKLYSYMKSKTKFKDAIGPLKISSSETTSDDLKQANILNGYFSTVFTEKVLANVRRPPCTGDLSLVYFNPDDVMRTVNQLKTNSSPGPDGITPRMLKEAIHLLKLPLSMLFNMSLQEGYVPKDWKIANVTPIFKKGVKCEPMNYRPISLTSHICKTMERILCKSIVNHLSRGDLLTSNQHGFRKNRSTTSNLLDYWNFVTEQMDSNIPVDVIYFDFSKAFDSVPHGILLDKLPKYNITGKVANWIEDWLYERTQRVVINGVTSDSVKVTSSVPQGSVLGPMLFQVYIDDMTDKLQDCACYLYADDTKIALATPKTEDCVKLQRNVNLMKEWADKNRMKFNIDKCAVLHFGKKNLNYEYKLSQKAIRKSSAERDLGVIISGTGKFHEHVSATVAKANRMVGLVKRSFRTRDPATMSRIYNMYIRPVIEYASPVWNPVLKGQIKALEQVQRRFWKRGDHVQIPGNETSHEKNMSKTDLIFMHKIYKGECGLSFQDFFKVVNHSHRTRQNDQGHLQVTRTASNIRKHSFSCRAIEHWNNVPMFIRDCDHETFVFYIKTHSSSYSNCPSDMHQIVDV